MRRYRERRNRRGRGERLRLGAFTLLVGVVATGSVYASAPAAYGVSRADGGSSAAGVAVAQRPEAGEADLGGEADLAVLERRVRAVTSAWAAAADYYDREVAPIEQVLARYGGGPELSERIAVSLVREGNRVGVEPRLLLAVLLVENPWLDPEIRSPVGAIGLMQIMPVHRGGWSPCGSDLEDVEDNICHGASIFAHYYHRTGGDLERALLRYNGCITGSNTPNCHQYPSMVFARAEQESVERWLSGGAVVDVR